MKLELREVCTRFKEAIINDFDERLTELKDKQPPYEYNRVKNSINRRYYDWILGYADELGNKYTNAQREENRDTVKRLLVDHMVRLTKNKALGIWLEKADSSTWEKIVWDMCKIDNIHYSRVLYRFTYSAIGHYLQKWDRLFTMNWGKKEGGEMFRSLSKKLGCCLNPRECPYWSTTEE